MQQKETKRVFKLVACNRNLLFLGSFGAVYVNDSLPPWWDARSIPNRDASFDL